MRIVHRSAKDDYLAMLVANAMEATGADVFSIVADKQGYHVYAKVKEDFDYVEMDEAISTGLWRR